MKMKRIGFLVLGAAALFLAAAVLKAGIPRLQVLGKTTENKVHVALGFHGNLYHSFRIDTNDEAGFGKDIRLIRHIIDVLDRKNSQGVPVKGVWDIENLFSLEEQLPRHAPDIIRDLQRRVETQGDEVILMSYNNGLASALNERELDDTVSRAITNSAGSGVQDLFGRWGRFVRPQEMMTTPGNFQRYREQGIRGVVLYYSSITFDAFRVFTRELTRTEAHNPLTYVNEQTGEEMMVIPAYNHGDLSENISLREWAEELHRLQLRGRIDQDVLLYINVDADAEFWKGVDVPSFLSWLPNTGGLEQIVSSVEDLDYVEFTTLTEYTDSHQPVGEISFGQDTADGSFNGYVSWSEKAYSSDYWAPVTEDRRNNRMMPLVYSEIDQDFPSEAQEALARAYEKRLRLQSTTNFGMATPFLARGRERVVESLIEELRTESEGVRNRAADAVREYLRGRNGPPLQGLEGDLGEDARAVDTLLIVPSPEEPSASVGRFLTLGIPENYRKDHRFVLGDSQGRLWDLSLITEEPGGRGRFYWPEGNGREAGVYYLYALPVAREKRKPRGLRIGGEAVELILTQDGRIAQVNAGGVPQLGEGSLLPMIRYGEKTYRAKDLDWKVRTLSGGTSVRLTGNFSLPGEEVIPGSIDYTVTLDNERPLLFLDGIIQWPDTPRTRVFKPHLPSLSRKYDPEWKETAPAELLFLGGADRNSPFKVLKRNYLGVPSSYPIDYYRHSRDNLNLANVNNHITAEYAALAGRSRGVAVAMDTAVRSNFAFCPLKVRHDPGEGFRGRLNPFGTYFGEQYFQPTWGNKQGFQVGLLSGDQYESAACTYSGHRSRFSLMIRFFQGRTLPGGTEAELLAYAHPPMVFSLEHPGSAADRAAALAGAAPSSGGDSALTPPRGFMAAADEGGVYFHWERPRGRQREYCISYGTESGEYDRVRRVSAEKMSLYLPGLGEGAPFHPEETYYAVIQSVDSQDAWSEPSPEIQFQPEPKSGTFGDVTLPAGLQLKILFLTLWEGLD